MQEPKNIHSGLWTFPIVLPDNPLKWLNCYVIKGQGTEKNLLIDTGFNRPECRKDLQAGIDYLGLTPENTDVFLSHLHSDHTGNAGYLYSQGYRMLISEKDYGLITNRPNERFNEVDMRFLREGVTKEMLEQLVSESPAKKYRPEIFAAVTLHDGDKLRYGGYELQCILTPGHTPGHMCLYDEKQKLLFLGDHVLFDISPNICVWSGSEDSLGDYLDSLRRISALKADLTLPAHRTHGELSMHERAEQLLIHHQRRLDETERIIADAGEINAYQVAEKMTWRIRAKNWDDFPVAQKSFAISETLAHLDYLVNHGRIYRYEDSCGNVLYSPCKT